jgi:2-dehydro-3-deoxygluconokinase
MTKNSKHVICFGELLLRLSPVLQREWIRTQQMGVFIGGAELNVATALATWGSAVSYVTILPDHTLSHEIISYLDELKIDTSLVSFAGERIGTYYLPQGTDIKHGGVIYDRAYSSFWNATSDSIQWKQVLANAGRFHFSAISPALNPSVAAVCKEAVMAASSAGIAVSVDLNDRARLWQYTKDKPAVMRAYMPHCKVVMGNIWSAASLLGTSNPILDVDNASDLALVDAAQEVAQQITHLWPNVQTIAFTFRMKNRYFTVLQHEQAFVVSKTYSMDAIVNQVGSGDCYMAALLFGLDHGFSAQKMVDFATAAARGKMTESGDATSQSLQVIEARMNNKN